MLAYGQKIKNTHELASNINLQEFIKKNGDIKIFERDGFSLVIPNEKLPNIRIDAQDGLFTYINGVDNLSLNLVDFFKDKLTSTCKFLQVTLARSC